MFGADCFPDGISRLANAIPLDQFPCHGRKYVIVFVDRLQAFAGKLAFHGKSDEELLTHKV